MAGNSAIPLSGKEVAFALESPSLCTGSAVFKERTIVSPYGYREYIDRIVLQDVSKIPRYFGRSLLSLVCQLRPCGGPILVHVADISDLHIGHRLKTGNMSGSTLEAHDSYAQFAGGSLLPINIGESGKGNSARDSGALNKVSSG